MSRIVLESIKAKHETMVLCLHDIKLALACTDRVIGLQRGRVIMDQSTAHMQTSDLDFLYQNG